MGDSSDNDDDYKVGYKKPPKHTQFKRGEVANRGGRKKSRHKILPEIAIEALYETVTVTINGKPQKITFMRLGLMNLAKKFAAGKPKAVSDLLAIGRMFPAAFGAPDTDTQDEEANNKILENLLKRGREESNDD